MYNIPKEIPGKTDDFYKFIGQELSRPEREYEINKYPRSFTSLLHFLSVAGYFDYKLMDRALSSDYLKNVYMPSVRDSSTEILSLDVSAEIECPGYTGARLSEKGRLSLAKEMSQNPVYYTNFIADIHRGSHADRMLKRIASALTKVMGPDWERKIYIGHALPNFFRPDIFLKLSADCETFEVIPENFGSAWIGQIKYPDDSRWVCVTIASRACMIRNTESDCIGSVHLKLRMLEKIGFNTILVKSPLWPEEEEEQVKYLKNLITECKMTLKTQLVEAAG